MYLTKNRGLTEILGKSKQFIAYPEKCHLFCTWISSDECAPQWCKTTTLTYNRAISVIIKNAIILNIVQQYIYSWHYRSFLMYHIVSVKEEYMICYLFWVASFRNSSVILCIPSNQCRTKLMYLFT